MNAGLGSFSRVDRYSDKELFYFPEHQFPGLGRVLVLHLLIHNGLQNRMTFFKFALHLGISPRLLLLLFLFYFRLESYAVKRIHARRSFVVGIAIKIVGYLSDESFSQLELAFIFLIGFRFLYLCFYSRLDYHFALLQLLQDILNRLLRRFRAWNCWQNRISLP